MTRAQSSNQCSGGIGAHPAPKYSKFKNPLEMFSPRFFFWSRHPPNCLSSTGPNYQRGVLLVPVGAIDGYFERKTPREIHKVCLDLPRQCPGSPDTCIPEEIGLPRLPMSLSPTPFSGSGTVEHPTVSWTEKRQLNVAIFPRTRRSMLPRRSDWTDKLWMFFSVLQKLEQRPKKYVELRGEYVE